MQNKLNNKYILKVIVLIFFFSIIPISLCACINPWLNRQDNLKNVIWQSEENDYGLSISFTVFQHGTNYGYIDYCGEKHEITMLWQDLDFSLCLVSYYGENLSNIYKADTVWYTVGGKYKILKPSKVRLTIFYDNLYNGALVSKDMTLSATKVNTIDYDISLQPGVTWENIEKNISITNYFYTKNFSVGTYNDIKVVTYWLENDRFSMYELVDNIQQDIELACGSYNYSSDDIILNFEKNQIAEDEEIALARTEYVKMDFLNWYPPSDKPLLR